MDVEVDARSPDERLVALAVRQHGLVTRRQLDRVGLGRGAIAGRLRAQRLHEVHRGVYAVGLPRLTRKGHLMAAVLAGGPGAVLSHRSAAELWGVLRPRGGAVEITVRGRAGRRARGVTAHRNALTAADLTTTDGIPVTRPGRTLVDLADVVPRRALERALDEAEYLRLDRAGLTPIRGRRGYGRLRAVLAEHAPGSTRTRSKLEEGMLALCGAHDLPRPEVNVRVEGHEVDCLWRSQRLIVETDGWAGHGTRGAFERDRIRDAELAAAGYRVMRVTYRRLRREPAVVAALIARLLARR